MDEKEGLGEVTDTERSVEERHDEQEKQPVTPPDGEPVGAISPEPKVAQGTLSRLRAWVHAHTRILYGVASILLLVVVVGIVGITVREEIPRGALQQFANVYSFVPEKISENAYIPIRLPEGVTEEIAKMSITFTPELAGAWVEETERDTLVFAPAKPLRKGTYYTVQLATSDIQLSGDFLVDEDPRIEQIFPLSGSEVNEDSEITIIFNRPMVPITTLSTEESLPVPVTVTPETKGRFKWVSTRVLQFIPETTLIPASEYTVSTGGFTSVDGLGVPTQTHTFTTRPLRYTHITETGVAYRDPMVIGFNQPVNLEKTREAITVTNSTGKSIALEFTYGTTKWYDERRGAYETREDRSVIFVYQKTDSHGRDRLWDFETAYTLRIQGAVPEAGSIPLTEERSSYIAVPSILASVRAESARTSLAMPTVFDPEGSLVLTFSDAVSIQKSSIEGKGIKDIAYGEMCKVDERGDTVYLGSTCEKTEDQKVLVLTFNAQEFGRGEQFVLTLKRVVTEDGFKVNADPITIDMRTYPEFRILRTNPGEGGQGAVLTSMTVCSNVPLQDPGEAGMSSYVRANNYIVFGRWYGSQYVDASNGYTGYFCNNGEFETDLPYGLLPETKYTLDLTLKDAFNQSAEHRVTFATEPPKEEYTRFHNLQQQYNVTRPDRTRFTFATENLVVVNLSICKLSPEAFLKQVEEGLDAYTAAPTSICNEIKTDTIELPNRFWVNNYFQMNLKDYFADTRGHYIMTFSSPLYVSQNSEWNQVASSYITARRPLYDHTFVSVTNLAVGKKEVQHFDSSNYGYGYGWGGAPNPGAKHVMNAVLAQTNNLYWVNESQTLTPTIGATVTQYSEGHIPLSVGVTGGDGVARMHADTQVIGAVVRAGADTAVVSDWADTLGYTGPVEDASRTYIYTDRPIYRPGHTVHVRGIDRIGFDGAYEVWTNDDVPLIIYDSRNEKVYDTKLRVSRYGTFSTEFTLPADAALGTYSIEAFGRMGWFDVEEYVPAAFKLEATSDQEEYRNGDTFSLDVLAAYYFGVPLSEGKVSYSVSAQDYYFDRYTDEYFNFGNDWYYCYSCGYGDNFLFRGETRIDGQGKAHIERKIDFDAFFKDEESVGSKLFTVSITAEDVSGRAVSMQKSFIVHKGAYYLGAVTDTYYTGKQSPVTLRVKSVDTEGKPIALSGIERIVSKVDWEIFKRQEVDGGFYYRSEKKKTEMSRETIKTDANGNYTGTLTFDSEGEYEITVVKKDEQGNVIDTTINIYIYGSDAVTVPPNNNYELDLEVEQSSVDVGDTGTLLIKSPYPRAKALITTERGTLYDYWIADVTGGLYLHTFPIKREYIPNVFVSALLLSPDPEVKYGTVSYSVDRKEQVLDVEVHSDKEAYLPGESVTLTVETKDYTGKGVPAEVSIAVADLSVLALKGNPKKDPISFFYDGFPLSVSTASNIKNILHEVDIPQGTKGGGGDPDDLKKKKRGIFKDTAYWNASVVTDASGRAVVTFTLPDNLTTWQIESVGITEDTKVGVDYQEFTTKKELMAVPVKPRFVVPGDTFKIGAKVFNQTNNDAKVHVAIGSNTLTLSDTRERTVSIGKGETKLVYFDAVAPSDKKAGEHAFTLTASFGTVVDTVEETIAITPNKTYETVAMAHMTKDLVSNESIYLPKEVLGGEGGLTVNANATLAIFMSDALDYMVTYPYGCSEQIASSANTIALLNYALTIPNVNGEVPQITKDGVTYKPEVVVREAIEKMLQTQSSNGGFAYYAGLEPNLWLTIHVLGTLLDLRGYGYAVRDEVIERARGYIETETYTEYQRWQNRELMINAEYVLRRANGNKPTKLTDTVVSFIRDDAYLHESINSMTLAYLAIMTAEGWGKKDGARVYTELQNRIDIDGRGAYLSSGTALGWEYYETPIKNTALLLRAFVAHTDEHEEMGNVLRWLIRSRDNSGAWGSTHNTMSVVQAMVEYLKWQKETEAAFDLAGTLGTKEILKHSFSSTNVLETLSTFVPIDAIPRATLTPLTLTRTDTNGRSNMLYYDMSLKYYLPIASLPPRDEGITVSRGLYRLTDAEERTPVTDASVGEVLKGKITVIIPETYHHVSIEDMIPAGFELVNQRLETERGAIESQDRGLGLRAPREEQGFFDRAFDRVTAFFGGSQNAQMYDAWGGYDMYGYDYGYGYGYDVSTVTRELWPTHTESHDDRVFLYIGQLDPGIYEYEYYLRALTPGTFQHLPARAEELYFPEVFGRTSGGIVTVKEE